jgi:hypothetical protein
MKSDWGVARQAWHAVEVIVGAGQIGQTLLAHDGDNERVAGKKFVLVAQRRC